MQKTILSATIAVHLIAGCTQNVWYKQGATSEAYGQDRLTCLQQSQQVESRSGTSASINSAYGVYDSKSRTGSVTNTSIFNACMNSKGWSLRSSSDLAEQNTRLKVSNNEKRDQMRSLSDQIRELCNQSEYLPFTSKTSCGDRQATLSMLSDKSMITSQQKIAMDAYTSELESLMNQQEKVISPGADTKLRNRIQCINGNVKPLFKKNDLNLFMGKINWGQYNTQKSSLREKVKILCPN